MKIATRLSLAIVGCALVAANFVGVASYYNASQELRDAAGAKLIALRESRHAALTQYLESIEHDLRLVATSSAAKEAIRDFTASYNQIDQHVLKRIYSMSDPAGVGKTVTIPQHPGIIAYRETHERYHNWFDLVRVELGYHDVFLVNLDGELVYSVKKEPDFATNLLTGEWQRTGLNIVVRGALNANPSRSQLFSDFKPYAPSKGAPASFISAPIRDGEKTIGVLAFQMPIGKINEIMHVTAGMGETGETYLVGPDHLMRSDSRFLQNSTILKQKVSNSSVSNGIANQSGLQVIDDYRGVPVLSAYQPIDFRGTRWVILSEIDLAEVLKPIEAMKDTLLIYGLFAAALVAMVGIVIAARMTVPLKRLSKIFHTFGANLTVEDMPYMDRPDEIGDTARAFGDLANEIEAHVTELRSISDTANDAIIIINTDSEILSWNAAATRIFGHAAEDAIGQHLSLIVPEHFRQAHLEGVARITGGGDSKIVGKTTEIEGLRKNGELFPVELSLATWVGKNGRVFSGILRDITARKQAEKALRESEETFRAVIDQLPAAVMLKDLDGRYTLTNRMFDEWLAPEGENVIGKTVYDILPKDVSDQVTAMERRVIKTGKSHQEEISQPFTDGTIHTTITTKFPIIGPDGQVVAVGTIDADITERRRAEEKLLASEERYALAMRGSNEGLWDWDMRADKVYISPQIRELLGVEAEQLEVTADEWEARIHPDDLEGHLEAERAHMAGETEFYDCEYRVLGQDGVYRWVHDRGLGLRDDAGEVYRIAGSFGDITERKNAEISFLKQKNILETTLQNVDQGILMTDDEMQIQVFNEKAGELTGFPTELFEIHESLEDATAHLLREILKLEDWETHLERSIETYRSREYVRYEAPFLDKILEIRQSPLDEGGIVRTFTDITERKQAEEKLRESEERYALAMRGSNEGLWDWDVRADKIYISPQIRELLGVEAEQLEVTPDEWESRIHLDDLEEELEAGRAHMAGETEFYDVEYRVLGQDGVYRWVHDRGLGLRDDAGEVYRIAGSVGDITERKQAEDEIRIARDAAEEATKAKAAFLATMSHEIRTPMNGVVGMVDILRQSKMTDDQRQMIDTVRSSAQTLLTIINDILDFSKIEAGKLDLEEIPISICDVVESAGEALAVNARNKNIGLSVYVDPEIPDAILGDQVRLCQILFNFGSNAIKFTEKGKVLIRADKVPSRAKKKVTVRFQVIDEGIGIPKEAQKQLFQAFSQVDASTTRRFGGTGLGLTICQRLTELMNGEIGVESVEGEGSTFSATITLPVAKEHSLTSDGHDLDGLNILFAHHDDDMRGLISRYLEHWKATVTTTAEIDKTKSMALAAAKKKAPFDVICVGSGWPINKQIEAVELLQAEKKLSTTGYVVACRGRVRAERKELDNTVYVDSGPVRRADFIRSIAVAAGRASPEVVQDDSDTDLDVRMPPTVAEAEAMGQLILLAEDNLTNQDVIHRQLTMLGYALEIANDGKEALELLQSKSFAILLTDCHMPNMDGFELTEAIRKSEKTKDVRLPIVAITASVMKEEVDSCFASGMDDYLPKPLEMTKLKEMLLKWMPEAESLPPAAKAKAKTKTAKEKPVEAPEEQPGARDTGDGPIDPSALKSVFGDDEETFKEILNDFVGPATSNAEEIAAAVERKSAKDVGAAAHKLKSSSRSVGAIELADLCSALEAAGKSDDWDTIDTSAPRLSGIVQDVTDYIKAL